MCSDNETASQCEPMGQPAHSFRRTAGPVRQEDDRELSLFDKVGYAWAIRIYGFVAVTLAIGGNFLIRSRLPPDQNAKARPDIKIFLNIPFTLTTVGTFLFEFGLFVPLAYVSVYALDKGFSSAFSFQIVTVVNAAVRLRTPSPCARPG